MHWVRPAKLQMSALPTSDLVTHSLKTSLIWLPHLPGPTAWSGAITPLKPNQPPEVSAAILGRSAFIAEVRSRRLVSCIEGPLQTNPIRSMSQQRTILSKSLRRNWVQAHRLGRACQSGDRLLASVYWWSPCLHAFAVVTMILWMDEWMDSFVLVSATRCRQLQCRGEGRSGIRRET